jgi:hypothetical protein
MPNSEAVKKVLTQDILGAQTWNGLIAQTVNMPIDDYERVEEAARAILERVASAVQWDRLLMEAHWRHMDMHPDKEKHDVYQPTAPEVCGECLREALLSEEPYTPDWKRYPSTPLKRQKLDWPTVVAEELEHRSVATWHPYKD